MPFCSSSAVRCVAGSRFEPGSVFGVFRARICLCRRVLVCFLFGCLGFFENPNTTVPPAFSFSPNLWWDYSSVYYLHANPSNGSSELILSSSHLSLLPAVGFLCWFVNFFFFFFLNLWALYPTTSLSTGWHSPWLAESSPSQFVHMAPTTRCISFYHVTCQFF